MCNKKIFTDVSPVYIFITRYSPGIRSQPSVMEKYTHHYDQLFPVIMSYGDKTDWKGLSNLTAEIKKFYFGDLSVSMQTGTILADVSFLSYFYPLATTLLKVNYFFDCIGFAKI